MSDRDVALFKSSLPRLINTPEGNRKIISTMLAMNEYLVREGELADAVIDGAITREQYREQIRALGNPLAEFSAGGGGGTGGRRRFDAQGREIK
jgi:flagellar protein FlgJ